jgi:hypothetical protein
MQAQAREPYSTDFTDEQWQILEPSIAPSKPGRRPLKRIKPPNVSPPFRCRVAA